MAHLIPNAGIRRFCLFTCVMLLCIAALPMQVFASTPNLIENGSFEDHPPLGSSHWAWFDEIPGWYAEDGKLEIQARRVSGIRAHHGGSKLEVDAERNSTVYTDVNTFKGQYYTLSLVYSPRVQQRRTDTNDIEVWWGDTQLATLSGSRRGWQRYEFLVKGERSQTRLRFKAAGRSDSHGGLLDSVSLHPVSNLVQNGSFEQHGDLNHGSWGYFKEIPHWRAARGNIEIQHGNVSGITAIDGVAKLELDADRNSIVDTRVPTQRNARYTLSFYYSPRVQGQGSNTNTVSVWWGNRRVATLRGNQRGWVKRTVNVRATGRTSRLRFRGEGTSDSYGGLIDDVVLLCNTCDNAFVDSDGDGAGDGIDAFPDDPTEWYDTDADGVGDNADTDDDGDGLPDQLEATLGLNPYEKDTDQDGTEDGQEDSDGDGLGNLLELQYGLDPSEPTDAAEDADGDGLSNAEEILTHGTDPAQADTDSDGLDDGIEIGLGTNPLLTDSDGDGIADGDEDSDGDGLPNQLELTHGLNPADPADAAEDADGDGLSNKDELLIHGTDLNNSDSDADALPDGVEVALGLNPTTTDSDGDGVTDADEDHDQDGLSNREEIIAGTALDNPDTDADGLQDGVEASLGLNPLAADSDGNGTPDGDEDSDGDGVSNVLEVANGFNPGDANDATQDADGDGLSNRDELLIHQTDPHDSDSDNDGLNDGLEVQLGLNPNAQDTDSNGTLDGDEDHDGDGLSNREEVAGGTAPDNPDTDGDGLRDGLEIALGLNPLLADSDGDGIADGEEDSDGDGLSNALELANALDPNNGDDAAADADGDGLSNADEILQHNTDPHVADTDGDQLPDGVEVALGLNPTVVDTDGDGTPDAEEDADNDGLSNAAELAAGTAPDQADTDGDGLQDGLEITLGLNPLTADTDGNGVSDGDEDSDGDGLSNALELAHALNPNNPADATEDADGDGLSNHDELITHATDPNNADSDADQLPDGVEIALGLNPGEADSDGDGTHDADEDHDSDGLSNQAELTLGTDPGSADSDADGLNDGLEVALELNPLAVDSDGNGVSDADEDTDGDGLGNALEVSVGLDPGNSADAAADADGDGLSNADELLTHQSDPNDADSDDDGLPDGAEILLGLDPNATDSDGNGLDDADEDSDNDGLSNAAEIALGTALNVADTDGDGLPDGLEVALALNPLVTDSDADGTPDADEDSDNDGLGNALELANGFDPGDGADASQDADNDGLSNHDELLLHNTDPHAADSDDDQLPDGVEIQLGLNPLSGDSDGNGVDDANEDSDNDGLSNADELAQGTAPGNPDTDADGLPDGLEVSLGLNPSAADSDADGIPDANEDSDGDGLSNGIELTHGLDPADGSDADADADNDGLSNKEELLTHQTDPYNADSDGDSLPDGAEVAQGIDPNNPDTDGDGTQDHLDTYPGDADRDRLAALTGLAAALQGTEVEVTWQMPSAPTPLAGVQLERRLGLEGEPEIVLTGGADRAQYRDDNVSNGEGYQYRVTALDARGNPGEPSAWQQIWVAYNHSVVSDLSAIRDAAQIALQWTGDSPDGYRVYRREADGGFNALVDTTATQHQDTTVETHLAYAYQVASLRQFTNPFTQASVTIEGPLTAPVDLAPFIVYELQLSLPEARQIGEGQFRLLIRGDSDLALKGRYTDALGSVRITATQGDKTLTTESDDGVFYLRFAADDLGTWQITAQDLDPTQSSNSASLTLLLAQDDQAPTVSMAPGLATSTAADSFVLRATANDADSAIDDVYAESDRFAGASFQGTVGSDGELAITVPLLHGPNAFTVYAVDASGNRGSTQHTVDRAVSLAPVLTVVSPSDGQVTSDTRVTVSGRVYTNQPADQVRVLVNDNLLQVSGDGGDQGYEFALPQWPLALGDNVIDVTVESPGGEVSQRVVVKRIDSTTDPTPNSPLTLTISKPLSGAVSTSPNILVTGQVAGGAGALSLQINGQPVPLGADNGAGRAFSTTVTLSQCDGSAQSVPLVLADGAGSTANETLTMRCDDVLPQITLLQPENLQTSTANTVYENPLPISGEARDANLAGLSVNGQSLVLTPTGEPETYRFSAMLQLTAGANPIEIQAWDKANNLQSLAYDLEYTQDAEITVLAPAPNSVLPYNDEPVTLAVLAQITGLGTGDHVSLLVNDDDSRSMTLDGDTARLSPLVQLREGDNRLTLEVHNADQDLLARTRVNFRTESHVPQVLEIARTEPAANSLANAPNDPLIVYFNKPVELADVDIQISQSVHGPEYDTSNQRGAGFTEIPEPDLVQLSLDQVPVSGSLAPFDNDQILGFYPTDPLYFGATVYVEVLYQGSTLKRFSYQVQGLPTIIAGGLVDVFNQSLSSVRVSIPELGLSTTTDSFGNYSFGGGDTLKTPIPSGRYKLLVNPDQDNPDWGTIDQWITVQESRINRVVPFRVPLIASTEPFVPLRGGEVISLYQNAVTLDLTQARLRFAKGREQGNAQVQMLLVGDLPHQFTKAGVPHFAWHLQAGAEGLPGIGVDGDVDLVINIPRYRGGYGHAPPEDTRVVILGLEERSLRIVPVGVGKVQGRQIINTTSLAFERLDYISYAAVSPYVYEHLLAYENGELASLAHLRAKLEEEGTP